MSLDLVEVQWFSRLPASSLHHPPARCVRTDLGLHHIIRTRNSPDPAMPRGVCLSTIHQVDNRSQKKLHQIARVQVNLFIGQQLIRQQPHPSTIDLATTSINLEQTRSISASGRIRLESDISLIVLMGHIRGQPNLMTEQKACIAGMVEAACQVDAQPNAPGATLPT
ncbi:hypothetical protein PGT21_026471 [Puccinia graminis f. sp. tritici]|uniref:Uncharacterized protein n=1 Tax=Puccinia graminis f. sp. tritici TaxID=56615 RepID=A0A5B0LYF8_PUCGR|nr:hypothetical protein PGT21_026471 [Puccinia graminis f. sp. tritici]